MDLLTAVAVSMLPVSRLRAAAALRALRLERAAPTLFDVLDRVGLPGGATGPP